MISKKCKRCDLLNHVKQKNIPYQVEYNQIMDKSSNDFYKWEVKLEFEGTHYIEIDPTHFGWEPKQLLVLQMQKI